METNYIIQISKVIVICMILFTVVTASLLTCSADTVPKDDQLGSSGVVSALPAKININKDSISVSRGKTRNLKVTTEGNTRDLVWISKDPSIAIVDSTGKVTGRKRGTTYIICKSSINKSISDKCKVKVKFAKDETIWLAHKGYSKVAPENTAVAIKEAVLAGFDGAEMDIWESKAEKNSFYKPYLLLSHSLKIKKYTGKNKKITRINHKNRGKYKIIKGNGIKKYGKQPIPTLEEALHAAWDTADAQGNPDFIVELDIKQEDISTASIRKIIRLAGTRNVRINTYYFKVAEKFKKYRRSKKTQIWVSCGNHSTWNSKAFIHKAAKLGLTGVSMPPERWAVSTRLYARLKGVKRAAFTNDSDKIEKLIKAGFDRICTNKKVWAN